MQILRNMEVADFAFDLAHVHNLHTYGCQGIWALSAIKMCSEIEMCITLYLFFLQTWFLDVSAVMSIFQKIVYEKRSVFGNKFKYFYVQQTTFKKVINSSRECVPLQKVLVKFHKFHYCKTMYNYVLHFIIMKNYQFITSSLEVE